MLIYNSQDHAKHEFTPIHTGEVRMYVCGPTVYDNIHVGNARTFLAFDVIRRYLMHKGYKVTFAQNLTDVDDKIINRANEQGRTSDEVASEFSDAFIEVMHHFGILDPDIRPRATQEISAMIEMIESLIAQGYAYAASNGDVYFAVRSCETYGQVSGRKIDELIVGARVEENEEKNDPLDFALWKAAKPGEPSWPSPWGEGRPGWHTECCAMIHRYLGCPIDIHGGGSDLAFPHHENESAQACCAWDEKALANIWMHTGMLTIDGEKMSKSLGNFYTLKEVLDKYPANAVRLLMLQTHYRSPLDFSFERLEGNVGTMGRLSGCVANLRWAAEQAGAADTSEDGSAEGGASGAGATLTAATKAAREEFVRQMDDDFNSAGALAAIFELVTAANTYLDEAGSTPDAAACTAAADTIEELLGVLGVELDAAGGEELPVELVELAHEHAGYAGADPAAAADALVAVRAEARAKKDWGTADAIRDGLSALGLVIEDTAAGTRVKRAE